MNREPVNTDDPQLTAFALGELSASEAAEFEARLQLSPKARQEFDELKDVMNLLGEGLKREWKSGCGVPSLKLLDSVPASNIVRAEFRPSARRYVLVGAAAAAAIAAMAYFQVSTSQNEELPVAFAADPTPLEVAEVVRGHGEVHVPRLMLAEEVSDLASLDLADSADVAGSGNVDATYLDAAQVIPASFHPAAAGLASNRPEGAERVDSYLPPLHGVSRTFKSGMIERRLGKSEDRLAASGTGSVLVRGYVTMGGRESAGSTGNAFQPVSISGNPVVNEESDLRLLADLNGLQRDLSEAIAGMPEDSHDRVKLARVLERSQRMVEQLKQEITR